MLGCDYSTMGMSFTTVDEKIKNLFSKRTKHENADGSRYDTYILFFSGLTSEDGSLMLGNGALLSPDHVINMWRESCCDEKGRSSSRLLLILDVARSDAWIKAVKSLKTEYVAVQSCALPSRTRRDVEEGLLHSCLGSFTSDWVLWNISVTDGVNPNASAWPSNDIDDPSGMKPIYAVSKRWSDFSLRVPSIDDCDLNSHWRINYFILCRPCLSLSAFCAERMRLVRMLGAPGRRYRRFKMRWFPPSILDTGHGFKLVNFNR